MWKVITRIAEHPTHNYPFGVLAIGPDGKEYQESTCRDYHDCLVFGNGMILGLLAAGMKVSNPNVQFDKRIYEK